MPRYIDAEQLKEMVSCFDNKFLKNSLNSIIEGASTLDLVPRPVRCGECELHGHCTTEEVFKFAKLSDDKRFCGVGKRKEQQG